MRVKFSNTFAKQYNKISTKTQKAFNKRLSLFIQDPSNSILHNHALKGKYMGLRSINVTGDWRALYSEIIEKTGEKTALFQVIGTHSQLYKR